jgi:hypothetical protein
MSNKQTESLSFVLISLSILLLLCWFSKGEGFKSSNMYGTFGELDGMGNRKLASEIGNVYFAKRTDVNHSEGLSDLEMKMVHRGRKNKPYVDLKWASEGLIGINNYEGIDTYTDVARAKSTVSGELLTVSPNASKSCDESCKSTGGYQLANIDFDPNFTALKPVYGRPQGYVTI